LSTSRGKQQTHCPAHQGGIVGKSLLLARPEPSDLGANVIGGDIDIAEPGDHIVCGLGFRRGRRRLCNGRPRWWWWRGLKRRRLGWRLRDRLTNAACKRDGERRRTHTRHDRSIPCHGLTFLSFF
jgi:hypothetical protein